MTFADSITMLSPLSIGRVLETVAPRASTPVGLRYHAVIWLLAAGEGIEAELSRHLRDIGITVEEFHALAAVLHHDSGPVTAARLIRHAPLSPAALDRTLRRLEASRLLTWKHRTRPNRGKSGIQLTPLGRRKIETAIVNCRTCVSRLIDSDNTGLSAIPQTAASTGTQELPMTVARDRLPRRR